jgi:hypothetical protein
MSPVTTGRPRVRRAAPPRVPFEKRLVLQQWMLNLFEADTLAKLAEPLKDPILEAFDDENISRYYHVLKTRLFERRSCRRTYFLRTTRTSSGIGNGSPLIGTGLASSSSPSTFSTWPCCFLKST